MSVPSRCLDEPDHGGTFDKSVGTRRVAVSVRCTTLRVSPSSPLYHLVPRLPARRSSERQRGRGRAGDRRRLAAARGARAQPARRSGSSDQSTRRSVTGQGTSLTMISPAECTGPASPPARNPSASAATSRLPRSSSGRPANAPTISSGTWLSARRLPAATQSGPSAVAYVPRVCSPDQAAVTPFAIDRRELPPGDQRLRRS